MPWHREVNHGIRTNEERRTMAKNLASEEKEKGDLGIRTSDKRLGTIASERR